ncbi:hypothetical protein HPP92_026514 [Vanilla planifolia]|uniref:Uncharacterized protein n=1 Tax=Vanilla planifolia TaxID=51239 RepID=A0A835U7H2_VANPL|nr:hypothetical protein HPP92_026514 [Vanilla planifolia]
MERSYERTAASIPKEEEAKETRGTEGLLEEMSEIGYFCALHSPLNSINSDSEQVMHLMEKKCYRKVCGVGFAVEEKRTRRSSVSMKTLVRRAEVIDS